MIITTSRSITNRTCSLPKTPQADPALDQPGASVQPRPPKLSDILAMRQPLDPKFFANAELQKQAPEAFALMPEAAGFHKALDNSAERAAVVSALKGMPEIASFESLEWPDKEKVMRKVFAKECEALNMTPPELVIESGAIPGPAFYDFDLEKPSPGTVTLNPEALDKIDNGYAPLLLLLHETRHSAQFQRAFLQDGEKGPVEEGYRAAFTAQRKLSGYSFADFTTLLNEYEAFQFANGVMEKLTQGRVDTVGMGTLAGQYSDGGALRTDLKLLFDELPHEAILDVFNELEKKHYAERQGLTPKTCC
jgi:hypothetical protein